MMRRMSTVLLLMACLPITDARASAPPGHFTVLDANLVKDNKTGLVWQRTVDARTFSWDGAKTYCQGLDYGGFSSGWRLPGRKELESIVDYRAAHPAIDATIFPSTPSEDFWTSSPARHTGLAYKVSFNGGASQAYGPTNPYRARCVR